MQQPRAGDAARDAGAAAAGRAPPSGAPAASGCAAFAGGVVRPPAVRRIRARSHTRTRRAAGSLQHACARSGRCARARAVFLRVILRCYTRCVRWPDRTRSCCACECAVVCPGPSRMALPVRVPAAELRACVQGCCSVVGPLCFDGWCLNRRPPGRILPPPRGLALQRGWALALAGRVMQSPESHRVNTDPAVHGRREESPEEGVCLESCVKKAKVSAPPEESTPRVQKSASYVMLIKWVWSSK
jgi:hypothetical protein